MTGAVEMVDMVEVFLSNAANCQKTKGQFIYAGQDNPTNSTKSTDIAGPRVGAARECGQLG